MLGIALVYLLEDIGYFRVYFKLLTFLLQFPNVLASELAGKLITSHFLYDGLHEIAMQGLFLSLFQVNYRKYAGRNGEDKLILNFGHQVYQVFLNAVL